MDTVRFGRALGVGAREAAKAMISAADAAASPAPGQAATRPAEPAVRPAEPPRRSSVVVEKAARTVEQAKRTGKGVREGGKRFGEAVWGPVVKLGGVLWLEFTGVFFALFGVFAAAAAWKDRGAWQDIGANHVQHQHLMVAAVMAGVFCYFGASSFIKAARRERR